MTITATMTSQDHQRPLLVGAHARRGSFGSTPTSASLRVAQGPSTALVLPAPDRLAPVRFESEADLYAPVKAYLEAQGYEVKSEVRGCDLVAGAMDERH